MLLVAGSAPFESLMVVVSAPDIPKTSALIPEGVPSTLIVIASLLNAPVDLPNHINWPLLPELVKTLPRCAQPVVLELVMDVICASKLLRTVTHATTTSPDAQVRPLQTKVLPVPLVV